MYKRQELGEAPMGFDRAEKLLGEAPKLDFVIGSVHMAGEKFKHFDLYYIENWTLGLDFKILFLTFFKGFVNKNAY